MKKQVSSGTFICRGAMILLVALLVGCAGEPTRGVIPDTTSPGNATVFETSLGVYAGGQEYVTVRSTGVQHWYDRTGPEGAPTVTLVNGSDFPAAMWHQEFVGGLLDAGYQVLRYDPRNCGRSERLPYPDGFKP